MKKIPVIFGVKSTLLSNEEREFFKNFQPIGFILFGRNIESKSQILQLVKELKDLSSKSLILIDQEGGRVCRLKFPIFRECPPAKYFGDMYHKISKYKAALELYNNYFTLMQDLLELGINVNTVPVADLIHENAHSIIGNRAFCSDPKVVSYLCSVVIEATRDAGGVAVIKHIPGHGRALLDSHEALPRINNELSEMESTDFVPFKNLSAWHKGQDRILGMSAHIIYDSLDKNNPATLSSKVISYVRENIGFSWDIMTDDICMKALNGSLEDITRQSISAGCNIVLHCSGELEEMKKVASVF